MKQTISKAYVTGYSYLLSMASKAGIIKDENAVAEMKYILGVVGGLVSLIVMFLIIPIIGGSLDGAVDLPADSDWNETYNSDMPDVASQYATWVSIIGVAIVIVIIGLILMVVKKFQDSN